jgi:Zn-finger nucleic acid-binding protein
VAKKSAKRKSAKKKKSAKAAKPRRVCPKCSDKLRERPLKASGIRVDSCVTCYGLWFDRWELEGHLGTLCSEIVPSLDARVTRRRCPACKLAMTTFDLDTSGVMVDMCEECKGVWLDPGELKRLEEHVRPSGGIIAALKRLLGL